MLDSEMIEQITEVLRKLESKVELVKNDSNHEKQSELDQLLEQVASSSDKVFVKNTGTKSPIPQFLIKSENAQDRIKFSGIPGGHEFTSLIIGILNADLKGKMPDDNIIKRIKAINEEVSFKTYISLSCHNCPEVVQALNLMSVLNPKISHEMIDGEYAQEEVERLKLQGVPSVVVNDKLFHSGKSSLIELLSKIEENFSKKEIEKEDLGAFDVAIIGAGPAGASAAIYSARKGLKTIVLAEKMGGQVQDTKGIENLISVPYTEGPQLANQLYEHMKEYEIKFLEHRRVKQISKENQIFLDSGEELVAKSIIIATGAKWRQLGIEGEKEYTGRGVAYCPHCDGPYYKGKNVAVIGGGNSGVEAAIDLAGITKSVTLFEFMPELKADEVLVKKLESLKNVTIIKNAKTSKVMGNGDKVVGLEYIDRLDEQEKSLDLDGIFVQIGLMPNSQFLKDIVETNKFGEIIIDEKNRTSFKGIYAAGDVTTVPYKQIIISMGEGAKAALAAFEDNMKD